MKKNFLIHRIYCLVIVCTMLCFAPLVYSMQRINTPKNYLRVDAGYSHPAQKFHDNHFNKKPKGAFTGAVGAGYKVNSYFKSDVTVNYRGNYKYSRSATSNVAAQFSESQKISSVAFMLNGYLSPLAKKFKMICPYLMGGVGLSVNKAGDLHNVSSEIRYMPGDQKRRFAWQIGAGVLFKIHKCINVDLMYKYADLGKHSTKPLVVDAQGSGSSVNSTKGKIRVHEVTIGAIYNFN